MGRTWLAILGYENAWSAYNYYFWVSTGHQEPSGFSSCRCSQLLQIPTFIPFIACFFGALTYDIFIYTGDSPINNGAWSYGNLRNGIVQWGSCILAKFGKGSRRRQSDEESLSNEQRENNLTSATFAEKKEHKSSSMSDGGNNLGRSQEDGCIDASEADGERNTGTSSGYELQDNRKPGFHGGSWESAPENTQNQRSSGHEEGHDDKSRETQQPANDTETQKETPDQSFEDNIGKESGYDGPKADTGDNGGEEDVDEHGNGT